MIKNLTSSAILLHNRFSPAFKSALFTIIILCTSIITSLGATITSFSPASGSAGTLVTVKGIGFTSASILTIGGVRTIVTSATTTQIVGIVMPGAITGKVTVNTSTNAATNFTVTETLYPTVQQGRKIMDTEAASEYVDTYHYKVKAVALSADGNTAIVSVWHGFEGGGVIIYTRQNGRWQQASPIINFDPSGSEYAPSGLSTSVALSADGSTAVMGGAAVNPVPVLVLRRVNGSWSNPLVEHLKNAGDGSYAVGNTVSITADGNTILVGAGKHDTPFTKRGEPYVDTIKIFNRSSEGWKQVPSPSLPGYQYFGYFGYPKLNASAPGIGGAISADGKTVALIAQTYLWLPKNTRYTRKPYTIIFSRTSRNTNNWVPQYILKEFSRVRLSADGNTLLATRDAEIDWGQSSPGAGSTEIYTRNGTTWSLAQVIKEDGEAAFSADGNTLLIANNATVYVRVGGSYEKKSELKPGYYATSAALSADGSTAFVGNPYDSGSPDGNYTGAVYTFGTSPFPGVPATNIVYNNVYSATGTTMGLSWTNGSGTGRAVFIKDTTAGEPSPADIYYSSNVRYHSGYQVDKTGWYCIYNGTGSTVNVIGLATNKTYRVAVMEYIGTIDKPLFLQTEIAPANVTTPLTPPTGYATGLAFSNTAATSTTLSWISSNGSARAVFIKLGTSGSLNVMQGTTYNANSAFGQGTQVGTNGWYCVYNGTGNTVGLSGLSASSTYRAIVIEYNGTAGTEMYNLERYNAANVTTTASPATLLTTNQKRMLVEQDALAESTTPELNIHQGMSPNGDGANDVFTIDGIGAYPQNTVKVMNSNGDVIYSATGYDNYLKAFDGHSAKGDLQKAGTYFYSLEYKKGADTIRKTGYLVIKY